jgi:hypothetical protein
MREQAMSGRAEKQRYKWAQVAEWLMAADCKSAAPRSYEGSNPSLCTTISAGVPGLLTRAHSVGEWPMRLEGAQRLWVALGVLGCTALLAWATMDAGKVRDVVLVLLAGFGLRIVLTGSRSE